jgi:hypothetical protein
MTQQNEMNERNRRSGMNHVVSHTSSQVVCLGPDDSLIGLFLDMVGMVSALYGTSGVITIPILKSIVYLADRLVPRKPSPFDKDLSTFSILFRFSMICYLVAISSQVRKINFSKLTKSLRQRVLEIFQKKAGASNTPPG